MNNPDPTGRIDLRDTAGSPASADSFHRTVDGARMYYWPPTSDTLPSVTAVLRRSYAWMPHLMTWQTNNLLDWIRTHQQAWVGLSDVPDERWPENRTRVRQAGDNREAADFGTLVHRCFEAAVQGRRPPGGGEFDWADSPVRGEAIRLAEMAVQALDDAGLRVVEVEAAVFRPPDYAAGEGGYAGTADVLAEVRTSLPLGLKEGARVVVDLKSTRNIKQPMRPQYALQVAAYAQAKWYCDSAGWGRRMPKVRDGFVLRVTPAGAVFYVIDMPKAGQLWQDALDWDILRRESEEKLPFVRLKDLTAKVASPSPAGPPVKPKTVSKRTPAREAPAETDLSSIPPMFR